MNSTWATMNSTHGNMGRGLYQVTPTAIATALDSPTSSNSHGLPAKGGTTT